MKASNGNNNKLRFFRLEKGFIDDAIRESTHLASTNFPAKGLPRQRKMLDTLDSCPSLIPEFVAKPDLLRIIATNRFPKFAPRR